MKTCADLLDLRLDHLKAPVSVKPRRDVRLKREETAGGRIVVRWRVMPQLLLAEDRPLAVRVLAMGKDRMQAVGHCAEALATLPVHVVRERRRKLQHRQDAHREPPVVDADEATIDVVVPHAHLQHLFVDRVLIPRCQLRDATL